MNTSNMVIVSNALEKRFIEVAEGLGWNMLIDDQGDITCVEFEKHSPAGEDFSFDVEYGDAIYLPAKVFSMWNGFDPEEHAEMWLDAKKNGVDGVPGLRTLIDDADYIKDMIEELYDKLEEAYQNFGEDD